MKQEDTKQDIQELIKRHLTLLEPNPHNTDKSNIILLIGSYKEVIELILNLQKTCIMALQADYISNTYIGDPNINIQAVLEFITQLMPYEEMIFLDEVKEIMKKTEN
ncbi:hypothetical protein [Thalassobellus citreus]|uniref:hypothetical protein n=1 Tax=Thalassobellus citreus TaxID=3367752 RepID=UPI00379A496A